MVRFSSPRSRGQADVGQLEHRIIAHVLQKEPVMNQVAQQAAPVFLALVRADAVGGKPVVAELHQPSLSLSRAAHR